MTVGVIANPASGKDIRRLVAQGSVFNNREKVNIIRRVVRGIEALGGRRVLIMPDTSELGAQALEGLALRLEARILDLPVRGDAGDSTAAAARMAELGAGCIVVLGGDGTDRAVAKGCGDVPLLPISTGTNNVFSRVVEGTLAGLAAQCVAAGLVDLARVTRRAPRLAILIGGVLADAALVDVTRVADPFIGSRALWQPQRLREAVVAHADPAAVGLAAVGGCVAPSGTADGRALYVRFGPGGRRVLAPLAPGLVLPIAVREHRCLDVGETVALDREDGTLALDGERELEISADQAVGVQLRADGPRVVDTARCLDEAARRGVFER